MDKCTECLYNGIVKENPIFALMLGMCPTLAVTISAINGLGMGLSTTVVLLSSNMIISVLRKIMPDRAHIPAYTVTVASLVTMVQLLLQVYAPSLYSTLGIYIPLIMVSCIILGRTESYVSKNGPVVSIFDGLGMGLGLTLALTCIGLVRETLGSSAIFGNVVVPEDYHITIFVLTPGVFLALAILTALQNKFKVPSATNGFSPQSKLACGGNCMSCTGSVCMVNHEVLKTRIRQTEEKALVAKRIVVAKKEAELKLATSKKENQEGGQTKELLLIATDPTLVNNAVLSQFLELCLLLGVSKKVETSAGMGVAVIFIATTASVIASLVHTGTLTNLHLKHLLTIVFILVIVVLVQFVEMFLKKSMPSLHKALGVYLPLITTNCAALGVTLTNVQKSYSSIQSVVNGIGISVGFTIAIIMLAGIHEKIEHNDVPYSFQGSPAVLVTSGLTTIAFSGSSGLI